MFCLLSEKSSIWCSYFLQEAMTCDMFPTNKVDGNKVKDGIWFMFYNKIFVFKSKTLTNYFSWLYFFQKFSFSLSLSGFASFFIQVLIIFQWFIKSYKIIVVSLVTIKSPTIFTKKQLNINQTQKKENKSQYIQHKYCNSLAYYGLE